MKLIEREIRLPRGYRDAELYLGGCLHYGHVGCNEKSIERLIEHIAAQPNRYLILLGDVIDAINVSDSRFNPREVAPWVDMGDLADLCPQQCRRAALYLKRIPPERILAFLSGNHPRKTRTNYYLDSHRLLADMLGIAFQEESVFLRMRFVGRDAGKAEPITFYLEHGSGGAGSPEAVMMKLKKQAVKHPGGDLYCGSHHHKSAFSTLTSAGIDPAEMKMLHREIPVVTAGCHLSYYEADTETYGENYHMPVASIGPAKVRVYPWGKPGVKKMHAESERISLVYPWWG